MTNTTMPTHFANVTAYTLDYADDYDDYDYVLQRRLNVVSIVIYSLVFVLGVLGNGLVIFITGFRMKKTVNTVWFLNLAIADFTFTFFLPLRIVTLALDSHWPFGLVMCKLNHTITLLNLYASVYLLMVISIDRCISVRLPVWAQNHRTPRLATFVILGVWILSLMLCSPSLYFRQTETFLHGAETVTVCYNNYSSTQKQARIMHHAMVTFQFTFAFVIPFGVIIFSYGAVILRLRRSRLSQSNKPFKIITAVFVAFFVCWFPYHVFSFLELNVHEQLDLILIVRIGFPLTSSLAFLNSCLNPILYVFMGHDFKEKLRHSLLFALENAFTEQSNVNTTSTKGSLSNEMESLKL